MDALIWAGTVVSVIGLVGLVWCILKVARAKKTSQSDEELRASIQKVVPLNLAALFMSVIGLMMVIVGIFLG